MRRSEIEPREDGRSHPFALRLLYFNSRLLAHCAGRELNPGYELGKLMSYH